MTRAKSLRPPKLATWLLEKFSPVLQNQPLAGDLIEAFKQGRSPGWYWRQVFGAILVGLLNFLRKQSGCLAYAACWSGIISAAWWFFWSPNAGAVLAQVSDLYKKGYGMEWPWSLVYLLALDTALPTAFQCVMVGVALSVYLALFHILNPRNLLRALMAIVVMLASINAAWVFLSVVMEIVLPGGWVLFSTVTLVALLLGMWKANLGGASRPISA